MRAERNTCASQNSLDWIGLFLFGIQAVRHSAPCPTVRVSVRVKINVRVSSSILPYCRSTGPHFTRGQFLPRDRMHTADGRPSELCVDCGFRGGRLSHLFYAPHVLIYEPFLWGKVVSVKKTTFNTKLDTHTNVNKQ